MKFLILTILFTYQVCAQPGGGGGLEINRVFDEHFNEINLNKDLITIKITLLDSNLTVLKKTLRTPTNNLVYLHPLNNYSANTQGLLIKYKGKSYRIDFENIFSENGAGVVEKIDSLVLFKPYILSKRGYHHPNHDGNEFLKYSLLGDLSSIYLKHGITPSTFKKLSEFDLMFDSLNFAYNRSPKTWIDDYKNLYHDFRQHNFQHDHKEIVSFLDRLDNIIKKHTLIDPFICFKIILLNELNNYNKIVFLFKEYPFKYPYNLYYINNIHLNALKQDKNYEEAILLSKEISNNLKEINRDRSYEYTLNYLFLKVYYQGENISKELNNIIKKEEYWQYYMEKLERFKILKTYNLYKFESKEKALNEMKYYNKKLIPDEIKKSMRITIQK